MAPEEKIVGADHQIDQDEASFQDNSGFEGPEKRLEIYFRPEQPGQSVPQECGLRRVSADDWTKVLQKAQCSILSSQSNAIFDAYLLSESSLFVYATKFMVKTCGTTTLLRVVGHVLEFAKSLNLEMDYVQYSRASFTYPKQQLHPHTSFQSEVAYLNQFFAGESYQLGSSDGATAWHLYVAGEIRVPTADQSFEVFMFDLDPSAMAHFFNTDDDGSGEARVGSAAGAWTAVESGVSALTGPSALIDAYNFDPCGFSMNGLEGGSYYTIHITPEPQCSYVSFECILPLHDFTEMLERVTATFRPRKFSVAFHADLMAPAGICGFEESPKLESKWRYSAVGDSTFLRMKTTTGQEVSATLCSYVLESDLATVQAPPPRRPLKDAFGDSFVVASGLSAKVFKSEASLPEIAEEWTKKGGLYAPTYLVDLSLVRRRLDLMIEELNVGRRELRYAVKFGSNREVLHLLDKVGCVFEAGSSSELDCLYERGIRSERILLSNAITGLSGRQSGRVRPPPMLTIFDDMDEATIYEVGNTFPNASVELRLMDPLHPSADRTLGNAESALMTVLAAGLVPVGVSFELSAEEGASLENFRRVMEVSHRLFSSFLRPCSPIGSTVASSLKRLSIGASFPGATSESEQCFVESLRTTSEIISEFFPTGSGVVVAVDPGQFVTAASRALLVSVVARRELGKGGRVAYYVDDGVHGAFGRLLHRSSPDPVQQPPLALSGQQGPPEPCEVWGISGEDSGRLWDGCLPPLHIGDYLMFENMGESPASERIPHDVLYILREQ